MTAYEMGGEPIHRQPPRQAGRRRVLAPAALLAFLAGCSAAPTVVHNLEGGQIAKPRPSPPGLDQPYPNLASVPARPAPPDQKALNAISQSLIADRENARRLTVPAPADPSLPSASPALFGVGSTPPPAPGDASATLAAAEAAPTSPRPVTPPAATPPAVTPSSASPAGGRSASAVAPAAAAPARTIATAPTAPAVNPLPPRPEVPPGPPAPPRLAAVAPPPGAPPAAPSPRVAQTPTAPVTRPAAPSLPADPAATVDVAFAPASAVLPAASADALRTLAKRRGERSIAVVGHGDSASSDPGAQSQAVSLGLQRAEAIAQALAADGVPDKALRLDALANGRGGSARLVE